MNRDPNPTKRLELTEDEVAWLSASLDMEMKRICRDSGEEEPMRTRRQRAISAIRARVLKLQWAFACDFADRCNGIERADASDAVIPPATGNISQVVFDGEIYADLAEAEEKVRWRPASLDVLERGQLIRHRLRAHCGGAATTAEVTLVRSEGIRAVVLDSRCREVGDRFTLERLELEQDWEMEVTQGIGPDAALASDMRSLDRIAYPTESFLYDSGKTRLLSGKVRLAETRVGVILATDEYSPDKTHSSVEDLGASIAWMGNLSGISVNDNTLMADDLCINNLSPARIGFVILTLGETLFACLSSGFGLPFFTHGAPLTLRWNRSLGIVKSDLLENLVVDQRKQDEERIREVLDKISAVMAGRPLVASDASQEKDGVS